MYDLRKSLLTKLKHNRAWISLLDEVGTGKGKEIQKQRLLNQIAKLEKEIEELSISNERREFIKDGSLSV